VPSTRPDTATKANRLVAYAFDIVMVGMAYWFVAYAGQTANTSLESPVVYAVLFFAYQLFFLRWNDGSSFGKSLRGICVISAVGTKLTPSQAVIRALALSFPFALFSAHDFLEVLLSTLPDPRYLAILPGALWCLAELYFAESDPMSRSVTDRFAHSLVVNIPPPQPHRAPAIPMYSATDAEFGPRPKKPPHPPSAASPDTSIERTPKAASRPLAGRSFRT
jgi:uncharacterized RDD family membrane protein YckC